MSWKLFKTNDFKLKLKDKHLDASLGESLCQTQKELVWSLEIPKHAILNHSDQTRYIQNQGSDMNWTKETLKRDLYIMLLERYKKVFLHQNDKNGLWQFKNKNIWVQTNKTTKKGPWKHRLKFWRYLELPRPSGWRYRGSLRTYISIIHPLPAFLLILWFHFVPSLSFGLSLH